MFKVFIMAKTSAFIRCLQAKIERAPSDISLGVRLYRSRLLFTNCPWRPQGVKWRGGRGGTKRCWRASLCVSEYDVLAVTSTSYLTFIVVSCTYEGLGRCCGSRTTRSTSPTLTPRSIVWGWGGDWQTGKPFMVRTQQQFTVRNICKYLC